MGNSIEWLSRYVLLFVSFYITLYFILILSPAYCYERINTSSRKFLARCVDFTRFLKTCSFTIVQKFQNKRDGSGPVFMKFYTNWDGCGPVFDSYSCRLILVRAVKLQQTALKKGNPHTINLSYTGRQGRRTSKKCVSYWQEDARWPEKGYIKGVRLIRTKYFATKGLWLHWYFFYHLLPNWWEFLPSLAWNIIIRRLFWWKMYFGALVS